jgi:hypothetical protein
VLELACAYLRNGYGVEGIPGYLDHMKRASLSDPEAVPLTTWCAIRLLVRSRHLRRVGPGHGNGRAGRS